MSTRSQRQGFCCHNNLNQRALPAALFIIQHYYVAVHCEHITSSCSSRTYDIAALCSSSKLVLT